MRKSLGVVLAAALLEFAARGAAVRLGAELRLNPGVAFGLLGEHPALACLLSALALTALLFCLWRFPRPGLAIMAGGAAANLADRLLWGA
jgi:lipoprotein signal peptidase